MFCSADSRCSRCSRGCRDPKYEDDQKPSASSRLPWRNNEITLLPQVRGELPAVSMEARVVWLVPSGYGCGGDTPTPTSMDRTPTPTSVTAGLSDSAWLPPWLKWITSLRPPLPLGTSPWLEEPRRSHAERVSGTASRDVGRTGWFGETYTGEHGRRSGKYTEYMEYHGRLALRWITLNYSGHNLILK